MRAKLRAKKDKRLGKGKSFAFGTKEPLKSSLGKGKTLTGSRFCCKIIAGMDKWYDWLLGRMSS